MQACATRASHERGVRSTHKREWRLVCGVSAAQHQPSKREKANLRSFFAYLVVFHDQVRRFRDELFKDQPPAPAHGELLVHAVGGHAGSSSDARRAQAPRLQAKDRMGVRVYALCGQG